MSGRMLLQSRLYCRPPPSAGVQELWAENAGGFAWWWWGKKGNPKGKWPILYLFRPATLALVRPPGLLYINRSALSPSILAAEELPNSLHCNILLVAAQIASPADLQSGRLCRLPAQGLVFDQRQWRTLHGRRETLRKGLADERRNAVKDVAQPSRRRPAQQQQTVVRRFRRSQKAPPGFVLLLRQVHNAQLQMFNTEIDFWISTASARNLSGKRATASLSWWTCCAPSKWPKSSSTVSAWQFSLGTFRDGRHTKNKTKSNRQFARDLLPINWFVKTRTNGKNTKKELDYLNYNSRTMEGQPWANKDFGHLISAGSFLCVSWSHNNFFLSRYCAFHRRNITIWLLN